MSRWFKCNYCKSEWPVSFEDRLSEWNGCNECEVCGEKSSWVESDAFTPLEKSDIRARLESYGHFDLADRIDNDGE